MKRLIGAGCSVALLVSPALGEVETEIPFGIEAVTGIRSDYVHRGFQLANSALDFQLETELTLSNETSLHFGLSQFSENGGDFTETSGYFELTHSFSKTFLAGASVTYRNRQNSLLNEGFDFGLFTRMDLNRDWRWLNELNFDLGVDGIWFRSALEWSTIITDEAFLVIEGGLSMVSGYLDRDGLNDFHTRISLTYALSDQISITPFLGTSFQIEDSSASDIFYGGVWFEVIF